MSSDAPATDPSATATTRESLLIDAAALAAELASPTPPIVLEISFPGAAPAPVGGADSGIPAQHIPGALVVDLATHLAGRATPAGGRLPLPEPEALQQTLGQLGIADDVPVVVYDDGAAVAAGRAWFVLTWAGLTGVRVLDGGLRAWNEEGLATTADPAPYPGGGTAVVRPGQLPTIDADEAATFAERGVLLDARGAKAYAGAPRTGDGPAQGHIPGAVEASARAGLDAAGRVLDDEALRARFADVGVTGQQPVAAYCGAGVAAAHQVFTLKLLGIDASLFVGSWSAWSADPSRPVAVGTAP